MKITKMYPPLGPLGYKWPYDEGVDISDTKKLREVMLNMRQWKDEEIEKIKKASNKKILDFFKDIHYEFIEK